MTQLPLPLGHSTRPILAVVDVRQFHHLPVLGRVDAVAQDKLMFELAVADLLALGWIRVRVGEEAPTS